MKGGTKRGEGRNMDGMNSKESTIRNENIDKEERERERERERKKKE